ncbi:hypothetical protein SAMN05444266_10484 [Chitinophaga jiangningensis]|uniref:Uncharacterized protein n=1 Tax=Chitinophaga jiangningensis TaxID=1419482 RepID=A0A1M7BUU6_9BACT|nr:hypothetical protein [Chitinophaga jiangningensis]SHL58818.1 hypothetical protein SAMN05444266_10484 [Chitinophaga jiangningensis]
MKKAKILLSVIGLVAAISAALAARVSPSCKLYVVDPKDGLCTLETSGSLLNNGGTIITVTRARDTYTAECEVQTIYSCH